MPLISRAKHDWPTLLTAARGWPALESFPGSVDGELRLLMQSPVAVAWWITTFAPTLAARNALEILVVCAAGGPATADDGRPYQLVPLLLARPDLRLAVTLVTGEPGAPPVRSVPHAQPSISLREDGGVDRVPAAVHSGTLPGWLDLHPGARPDLCLLLHPAFDENIEFWRGLRPILAAGIPVGCFGRGPEKLARDAWLLEAYGYDLTPAGVVNPWAARRPESKGHGAWAAMGWQLQPAALPPPAFAVDRARLDRAREAQQFMEHEFQVWNPLEFVGRTHVIDGDAGDDPEQFIGLPDHHAVSCRTGEVWAVEADCMVPVGSGLSVPLWTLATYPGAHAHTFLQLLWAVEFYRDEFRPREAAHLRQAYGNVVDELESVVTLNGKASAPEIAAITELYVGGSPATPVTPGSEALFAALAKRDWEVARAMMALDPALIRAEDEDGRTPLFHAMAAKRLDIAQRWLEAGADPDHLDHEGFAVLHDAVKRDAIEPVELLHRHGADLDLGTGLGYTPALIAMRYGRWNVLAYLVAQGADLHKATRLGTSVADQYEDIPELPRSVRRALDRRLGRHPVIPIAVRGATATVRAPA